MTVEDPEGILDECPQNGIQARSFGPRPYDSFHDSMQMDGPEIVAFVGLCIAEIEARYPLFRVPIGA